MDTLRPRTLAEARAIPLPFRIRPSGNDQPMFTVRRPAELPNAYRRCLLAGGGGPPRVDDDVLPLP